MKFTLNLQLPKAPARIRNVAIVIMGLLVLVYAVSIWFDFPHNGNPYTWITAKEAYVEGSQQRSHFYVKGALEQFEKATRIYPQDGNFQYALGECLERLQKFPEAEKAMLAATALKPKSVQAWLHLSSIQFALGKRDDAEKSAKRALEIVPNHSEAQCQLALMLAARGDIEGANKLFSAISRDPKPLSARYLFLAAQLLDQVQNQPDKAMECYRRAARSDYSEPEYAEGFGVWLETHGKPGEAAHWLKLATSIDPQTASYQENYGLGLMRLQNYDQALSPLKRAMTLDPTNQIYQRNFADLLHAQRHYEVAMNEYKRLIDKGAADESTWKNYVDCLLQIKKIGEAKQALQELSGKGKPSDQALANRFLADIFFLQMDGASAKSTYQKALSLNPPDQLRDYCQRRIKEIDDATRKADQKMKGMKKLNVLKAPAGGQ